MSNTEELLERNQATAIIQSEMVRMLEQGYTDTSIVLSFSERGVSYSLVNKILQKAKLARGVMNKPVQGKVVTISHTPQTTAEIPVTAAVTALSSNTTEVVTTVSSTVDTTDVSTAKKTTAQQTQADMTVNTVSNQPVHQPVHTAHLLPPEPITNTTAGYTAGYPNPFTDGYPTSLTIKGRKIDVTMIKRNPDIMVFDNVLTQQECSELIEYASTKIRPSNVVDRQTGEHVKHNARTSSGAMFRKSDTPLLRWMEEFSAELLKWPYENSEGFQILNYQVGQEYKAHFDHFDPNTPSGKVIADSVAGNRVATLLFYLNDTEEGGGTDFPNLQITIMPKVGRLAFFGFPDINNTINVLHAGLPPIKGEKWVAVNWFRQGVYSS